MGAVDAADAVDAAWVYAGAAGAGFGAIDVAAGVTVGFGAAGAGFLSGGG